MNEEPSVRPPGGIRDWLKSPVAVRVVPFAVFALLTVLQGSTEGAAPLWIYLLKTCAGASLLAWTWPYVREMRWNLSWEAVAVGILVFVLWVGIDPWYPKWSAPTASWNPLAVYGAGSAIGWFLVGGRIAGSSLVVPMLEEVFYRSFFYRYLVKPDLLAVGFRQFAAVPFLVTSAVFGFAHHEWLAGILCGFAYQGLVLWKGRLGDAITAHGITNLLLGLWVVWKGAWHFW